MAKAEIIEFYAPSVKEWRAWLKSNGNKADRVWLLMYKKNSGVSTLTYAEAVEEALCFGWIDSKPNKRDDKSFVLLFARRNPKSKWSAINKQRVEMLIRQRRMTKMGMQVIEEARKNGAWSALDDVDQLVIPPDLARALQRYKTAASNFEAFPRSVKRGILEWIGNAKKTETRAKRIEETARLAGRNIRANQYRPQ